MTEEIPRDLFSGFSSLVQPAGGITCLGNAGGLSGATLWRFRAPLGELVCRAWPPGVSDVQRLARIHSWLGRCRKLNFVPVPLATLDGQTLIRLDGRFWEIAPWLPGEPDVGEPPRLEHVESASRALARFHIELAGESSRGRCPGLLFRVGELQELEASEFGRVAEAIATQEDHPALSHARRWLLLAQLQVPRLLPRLLGSTHLEVPHQPCLRDARPEHFLFQGGTVSGLVDFGSMDIDAVSVDLARLLGEWLPDSSFLRDRAIAAYTQIRPLDESELALITAMQDVADVLIAGHWITWWLVESRRFDDTQAALRRIEKGITRLERSVASGTPSLSITTGG